MAITASLDENATMALPGGRGGDMTKGFVPGSYRPSIHMNPIRSPPWVAVAEVWLRTLSLDQTGFFF